MQLFLEQMLNGLAIGAIYTLISLGLALAVTESMLFLRHPGGSDRVFRLLPAPKVPPLCPFTHIGEVVKPVQDQTVKNGLFRRFGIVDDPELVRP